MRGDCSTLIGASDKGELDHPFHGLLQTSISCIQLLGELLYKLLGLTNKPDTDLEDEEAVLLTSKTSLKEVLGQEKRNRVLAGIYIVRQDPSVVVRQMSIHVWKALVQNTPRTIREILPSLSESPSVH